MKHKIKWLMTSQCKHHYITTSTTSKRKETVHLVEWGLTQEWIHEWSRDSMKDHSLDWLGRNKEDGKCNSAQHDFLSASHLSNSDAPLGPYDLDFFFLWDFWAFSCPSCAMHSLSCFALQTEWWFRKLSVVMLANTWHMPHDCHPIVYLSEGDGYCFGIST